MYTHATENPEIIMPYMTWLLFARRVIADWFCLLWQFQMVWWSVSEIQGVWFNIKIPSYQYEFPSLRLDNLTAVLSVGSLQWIQFEFMTCVIVRSITPKSTRGQFPVVTTRYTLHNVTYEYLGQYMQCHEWSQNGINHVPTPACLHK